MARETVRAADGRVWVVRRRWTSRPAGQSFLARVGRKMRAAMPKMSKREAGEGLLEIPDLELGAILLGVVVLAFFIMSPLIVGVVETAALVLAVGAGVVARVVFRRPWVIEARADDGTVRTWEVVGWRASSQQLDEAAAELRSGVGAS